MGESVSLVPTDLRQRAARFIARLPAARTPLETLTQKGLLLDLAVQFGYAAHKAFHQHAGPNDSWRRCPFKPAATLDEWPHDLSRSTAHAFQRWAVRFASALQAAHPATCVYGAEHYVKQHYRTRIAIGPLARHVGCSPAYLQRTFKERTGFTLREYQSELRLQEALTLLLDSDLKIEAIAREVGYHSKKDLYRIVEARVGCTPLEFRKRRGAGTPPEAAKIAKVAVV